MKLTKIRKFVNETPELTMIEDEGYYMVVESKNMRFSISYRRHGIKYYETFKSNGIMFANSCKSQKRMIFWLQFEIDRTS